MKTLKELLASFLLCWVHLTPVSEYGDILDAHFLCDPENPLLLELEWSQSDLRHARALMEAACVQAGTFDRDAFGRFLLRRLQRVYKTDTRSVTSSTLCIKRFRSRWSWTWKSRSGRSPMWMSR